MAHYEVFYAAIVSVTILMHVTFVFAAVMKRNDLADVVWGPGFIIALVNALLYGTFSHHLAIGEILSLRAWIALLLISLWGLRLSFHIGKRNLSHNIEDARYKKWREEWGTNWLWRSYLQVFILQGILLLIIASPSLLIAAYSYNDPAFALDTGLIIGSAVWLAGFTIEALADEQLADFKKDKANKGRLINSGLWRWSRHPNYFGEVTQWWGLFLIALPLHYGWLTAISPLAITFLILKVSGVPMLEKHMTSRPGFAEYKRKTSAFIPLPPKKS